MSTVSSAVENAQELVSGRRGPVASGRQRRTALLYGVLCALGLAPTLLSLSPGWQAAGLGLFLPGAGFWALGGWWLLLVPVTLALFWVSIVAWFWAGMLVAPLTVWAGSAALAGALIGDAVWAPAPYLAPLSAAAVLGAIQFRNLRRRARDRAHYELRQGFFADSLAEVRERVRAEPAESTAGERELAPDQLAALRYALERALQPVGEYKGYTIIDQFQPAAIRYQINHTGYALAMAQCHYTPSFKGYMQRAQRNVVETYLDRKVWGYWALESMWGHFNFTNWDPVGKGNIMVTGWYGLHFNQYMQVNRDYRYAEPGALTFRWNDKTAYRHDAHTITGSIVDNMRKSDFCLFPCEPNWVYPICNMYGMGAIATYDRVFGTRYADEILPRWLHKLETEFTDAKGTIIPLRSELTGIAFPFYSSEAGFAFFANVFSPELAQRLWAIGRKELGFFVAEDDEGRPRLRLPQDQLDFIEKIDPGNYRPGLLFAYAAILISAREFGDHELAEAARRSMDQDCGLFEEGGVAGYAKGSNLSNIWAVEGKLMGTGDFRNSFIHGPPESVFEGPVLAEARYPEVLVAKAFSDGRDLDLVLYPGVADGVQTLELERLAPGARYRLEGARTDTFAAADDGRASLQVELAGRTPLYIAPEG